MKLGITASLYDSKFGPIVFRDGKIVENIRIMKEMGYEGVDLFANRRTEKEIDDLRAAFEKGGVEVAMYLAIFLAEMGLSLSCSDEEKRKDLVREYKNQITLGSRIGAKKMPIGLIRGSKAEGETMEACLDRLAKSVDELCSFAVNKGIKLCVEPINRYEINTLNNVDESLEFINKYGLTDLGLLLDGFHMNIEDASIEGSIAKAGKYLEHFHASDSNRYITGSGHLNYDSILKALKKVGYDGYLMVEVFPKPDPLTCAVKSAKFLKEKLAVL